MDLADLPRELTETKLAPEESELLESLGLPGRRKLILKHGEQYFLGNVKGKEASVAIYIIPMPAHFFRFEITDLIPDILGKHAKGVITTGSGTLNDFWKTMELFLEGMLAIKGS